MRFTILFLLATLLALINVRLVRATGNAEDLRILARAEEPPKDDKADPNKGQQGRKGGQDQQDPRAQGNGAGQQGGQGTTKGGDGQSGNGNKDGNTGGATKGGGDNQAGAGNKDLQLQPDVIQKGSESTGQGASGSDAGQAASDTSDDNFINFCEGDTLTNGAQVQGGSCNGIVMGKIPAQSQMVSAIIVNPKPGEDIAANQAFDIKVQTSNLKAGSFTNPQATYYAAPQDLDGGGDVIGHAHVVIQDMGGTMTPTNTLDASKFAFFKGINDAGNGDGLLTASVDNGLPAGTYRVCTMNSASNHQPVVMPVAQRGSQDDCTKFTVGQGKNANGNGGGGGGGNGDGNNGNKKGGDKQVQDQGKIGLNKIDRRLVRSAKFVHPAFSTA
ncbi:hypothetical protein HDK77DRAFT_296388 [Phyllosticta capitalensis]|uniref:Ribosomal protein s17 n=1 Tax=Phyllosticta capitalensis TaxID=121624 RepID=A0ABR1YFD8_9PEZI